MIYANFAKGQPEMLQKIIRAIQPGVQKPGAGFAGNREAVEPTYHEYFHDIIECLIAALEANDTYTSGHSTRVADMSLDMARALEIKGERWDGRGYPQGLRRNHIPLGSRIIAVADAVDAMTTDRPYKKPLSWEDCYQELQINKEKQFDPMVVEAAAQLWRKWAVNRQDKQTKDETNILRK